jgi:hypothetical protein
VGDKRDIVVNVEVRDTIKSIVEENQIFLFLCHNTRVKF